MIIYLMWLNPPFVRMCLKTSDTWMSKTAKWFYWSIKVYIDLDIDLSLYCKLFTPCQDPVGMMTHVFAVIWLVYVGVYIVYCI